uniref:Pentatricopeptide repeat-containing protein n=1 Tax=Arundo donax TaxID=35708 RepID=A0A0A8ZHZ6_ARUDO
MFQNLCLMDFRLDSRSSNIMIDALLRCGRKDESLGLFAAISTKGCVPNVVTYRLIIVHLIEEGLVEEADRMFLSMENNGCAADSSTSKIW